jgi:Tautomerase enzyme
MPLLRFDIFEGRSPDQLKALLNATHSALVAAFRIPERDRYQIVHEHPTSHFIVQDSGLGIPRTKNCVLLHITTRPRGRRAKEAFYHLLCESLKKECDIDPSDVVVSMVTNSDEDWSFGNGRAQFLTGELEGASTDVGKATLTPASS